MSLLSLPLPPWLQYLVPKLQHNLSSSCWASVPYSANLPLTTHHHSSPLPESSSSDLRSASIYQAVMASSFIRSNYMFSRKNPFISGVGCTYSNVPRSSSLYLNPRCSWSAITWSWADSPSTIGYGTIVTPSPPVVVINCFQTPNFFPCLSLGYLLPHP